MTGRGTHQGEFLGIPATGNEVQFPLYDLARIEDGKIVEHWELFGMFGLLLRPGAEVVPPGRESDQLSEDAARLGPIPRLLAIPAAPHSSAVTAASA